MPPAAAAHPSFERGRVVQGLIALLMKGRTQAIVATVMFGMLALTVTPVAIASAAVVVLATLRNGGREGLLVVVSATLAMAGLGGLMFGMPLALAILGLILWLPAWGLASVLGRSGSLARTLEAASFGAVLLVVAQYLLLGDPAEYWEKLLREYVQGRLDPAVIPQADQQQLLGLIAAWMPGGVAVSWLLLMTLAVFVGRWAQARLDKPGAFGEEFRQLRFSRTWLLLLPVLLASTFWGDASDPSVLGQLYLVGMTLYLFQGISMVHGLVKITGAQAAWLFGLYFLMLVGAPHSVTAIAAAGYADGWLDFRAKVRARPDRSQGPD